MADYPEHEDAYMLLCWNTLDDGFGYSCGPIIVDTNLNKDYAKAIAKHKNKELKRQKIKGVHYFIEAEPDRYW